MSRPQILHIVDSKRNKKAENQQEINKSISSCEDTVRGQLNTLGPKKEDTVIEGSILTAQEENGITSKLRSIFEERSQISKHERTTDEFKNDLKYNSLQLKCQETETQCNVQTDGKVAKPRIIATLSVEDGKGPRNTILNTTAEKPHKTSAINKDKNKSKISENYSTPTKPAFRAFSDSEPKKHQNNENILNNSKHNTSKNTIAENNENQQRSGKYDSKTKAAAFDGLLQYLQDYRHGLRELLVNNNVVIIEPIRESDHRQQQSNSIDIKRDIISKKNGHEISCRITGATIKKSRSTGNDEHSTTPSSNTLPRQQKSQQPVLRRHFFYYPRRSNRELVDEELPDPDTVKNARKIFEKSQRIITPENGLRTENGDPLNIKSSRQTYSVDGGKSDKNKRRLVRYLTLDTVLKHNTPHHRWTDSGSVSSGVSSDLSCYETDLESPSPSGETLSRNSSHKEEHTDIFSSDDNDEAEGEESKQYTSQGEEQHYVAPEVLEKIRACGTSVTYYGGRVISYTKGPQMSPMTSAIMNEIRQRKDLPRGIKVFRDKYLGVKFRLVKSNSCGSRLELAGTEYENKTSEENIIHVNSKRSTGHSPNYSLKVIGEEKNKQGETLNDFVKNEKSKNEPNTKQSENVTENYQHVTIKHKKENEKTNDLNISSEAENETDIKNANNKAAQPDTKSILEDSFKRQEVSRKTILSAYNMIPSTKSFCDDMEFEEFEVLDDTKVSNIEKGSSSNEGGDKKTDNKTNHVNSNNENCVDSSKLIQNKENADSSDSQNDIDCVKLTTWANQTSRSIMFDFRDSRDGQLHSPLKKTDNHSSC